MNDREKIISEIEEEIRLGEHWDECYRTVDLQLLRDILALLKEQEPVRVGKRMKAGDAVLDFYECGHCKNAIRKPWRCCPFCGRLVKWK